jgi:glycosyltransferase involved in cell wall biosynthesis
MWWGTLPIVSPISCLSFILDDGKRGVIVAPEPDEIASSIIKLLKSPEYYESMCLKAMEWSRGYTTERFNKLIKSIPKI